MNTARTGAKAIVGLLADAAEDSRITARPMFGEFGPYLDGRFFAVVRDGSLFLKPTASGRAAMRVPRQAPPHPDAKPWLKPDAEDMDDPARLARIVHATIEGLRQ